MLHKLCKISSRSSQQFGDHFRQLRTAPPPLHGCGLWALAVIFLHWISTMAPVIRICRNHLCRTRLTFPSHRIRTGNCSERHCASQHKSGTLDWVTRRSTRQATRLSRKVTRGTACVRRPMPEPSMGRSQKCQMHQSMRHSMHHASLHKVLAALAMSFFVTILCTNVIHTR